MATRESANRRSSRRSVQECRNASGSDCLIIHFFRGTDPRCSRAKFLENALSQFRAKLGVAETLESDPAKRDEQFERLLPHSWTGDAARKPSSGRIVFLLDGLDEVCQLDRGFADLVLRNLLPGVVWVCSGREEFDLGRHTPRPVLAIFPSARTACPDSPKTTYAEVLDLACGRQVYELLARDQMGPTSDVVINPFLMELVRRSDGLPLYLRLLVQDIREGRISFREGEEKRLPQGLSSYFKRVLERLQVSDVSAILTPVFGILAQAKAPLSSGRSCD